MSKNKLDRKTSDVDLNKTILEKFKSLSYKDAQYGHLAIVTNFGFISGDISFPNKTINTKELDKVRIDRNLIPNIEDLNNESIIFIQNAKIRPFDSIETTHMNFLILFINQIVGFSYQEI